MILSKKIYHTMGLITFQLCWTLARRNRVLSFLDLKTCGLAIALLSILLRMFGVLLLLRVGKDFNI